MVSEVSFWQDRSVLVTGHTGFKGAWLSTWLNMLGARVAGYALAPDNAPNMYEKLDLDFTVNAIGSDVRNLDCFRDVVERAEPSVIFHLAAQSLVRDSYRYPVETYQTNVLGTANVLEAAVNSDSVRAVVVVTTDKCYENRETLEPYVESDRLGGHDPYSSSKACAELVCSAYRSSFASSSDGSSPACIATARAGNVIGGGDWSFERLVPDLVRSIEHGSPLSIRNPDAVRPWQFVMEPLSGYLQLAERLVISGKQFAEAWNFGPQQADFCSVRQLLELAGTCLDQELRWEHESSGEFHEAALLTLNSDKAVERLKWRRKLPIESAVRWTLDWHKACAEGENMRDFTEFQINEYACLQA